MTTFHGQMNGHGLRFALVCSRFNDLIVGRLEAGARDALLRHGAAEDAIDTVWVPGAWEIPLATARLCRARKNDPLFAVIALGAVIRGSTPHFDHVANEVSKGVATVSLETGVPAAFGVLTTDSIEQAIERAGTKAGNKGWEAAVTAIEMIGLNAALTSAGF